MKKEELSLIRYYTELTQKEFAAKMDIPYNTYRGYEGGQRPINKHFASLVLIKFKREAGQIVRFDQKKPGLLKG